MAPHAADGPPSARTQVRREPHRGVYDRAAVDAVLDASPVWAGTVPVTGSWGEPVPDPSLRPGIPLSASVLALQGRA